MVRSIQFDQQQEHHRENVFVHPRIGVARRQHSLVRHGDQLVQADPAIGTQETIQHAQVSREKTVSDGLDHLDGDDGVATVMNR